MEILKGEGKKKLFGKLLHSKNYSITREILQLHFEKVIHVYIKMVITKMENGNSEILNVPRESRKIVKNYKKNTREKKIEKSKLFTFKANTYITKNSIFFLFFFKLFFPKMEGKFLKISSWHFSFQIGKKQCLHTISRILDTVLRRFERKAFVREMQSRSEPCATNGVVWIAHFICLPFSRAPRANSTPFGSDRSIVRNPTTGMADTSI